MIKNPRLYRAANSPSTFLTHHLRHLAYKMVPNDKVHGSPERNDGDSKKGRMMGSGVKRRKNVLYMYSSLRVLDAASFDEINAMKDIGIKIRV